jgi:hypothetical protein
MSTLDISVPCFNRVHYLGIWTQSALSQRDAGVRVLIADGAPPDNRPEAAGWLAEYVRSKSNPGLTGTSNKGGINWAAAGYAVLLSAEGKH